MKIAIIGGGVSGLTCAHYLSGDHEITLLEAADYLGGHTNTVMVNDGERDLAIDTGFIVFNDRTYPNFVRLMDELGVASQPTTMSLSVRCEATGLEYRGANPGGLFAQPKNLFNWRFLWMLREIVRFNGDARRLLTDADESELTVGEYLRRNNFSQEFVRQYFLPMGSAIWSCPHSTFAAFPMRFIAEFYSHHGLLSLRNRPQWRVIQGGSKTYVDAMRRGFENSIHLNCPVRGVSRREDSVEVTSRLGQETYDHVIFACHSDQAMRILGDEMTEPEREVLSSFPYEPNEAVLHTDESLLPRARRAWACWNYLAPAHDASKATVTYNMNLLQSLPTRRTYCVTLNNTDSIDPAKIIRTMTYHHPVFTLARSAAQARHGEFLSANRTSFCGAYWGNGFHEDGVASALAVCQRLRGMSGRATQPAAAKLLGATS